MLPNWKCPWHSAWWGWSLAGLALIAGLPPYFRMPPWCDLTLYDMAAHAILRGGMHYRDVFDTNLPGFVWLLVGVRKLFGPSWEAVRAVDLGVVIGEAVLLMGLARRAGASSAALAWFAAWMAVFYPFLSEFNHGQRDIWMLLPALLAIWVRYRHMVAAQAQEPGPARRFGLGLAEGILWGCAVWIKPHVIFPAGLVWLVTAWSERSSRLSRRRTILPDFLGNFLGGGAIGLAGLAWLVGTGTWPYFHDVFSNWNAFYVTSMVHETGLRLRDHLYYFVPWSFFQPLAIVLALQDIRHYWRSARGRREPLARMMLALLFLGWVFQGLAVQRRFHYVHVPETMLMMAIFAVRGWAMVPIGFAYLILAQAFHFALDRIAVASNDRAPLRIDSTFLTDYAPRHGLFSFQRHEHWMSCWLRDLPPQEYRLRQDAVSLHLEYHFASISCYELGQIADELKRLGAHDGDVLCWHDSPHAVLRILDFQTPFRFMHVTTTLMGDATNPRAPFARMLVELDRAAPNCRFLVTDLRRYVLSAPHPIETRWREQGADRLPPAFGPWARATFPLNQRVIFRSTGRDGLPGRYLLHRLKPPIGLTEYEVDVYESQARDQEK